MYITIYNMPKLPQKRNEFLFYLSTIQGMVNYIWFPFSSKKYRLGINKCPYSMFQNLFTVQPFAKIYNTTMFVHNISWSYVYVYEMSKFKNW
jgi:hypothetical protein